MSTLNTHFVLPAADGQNVRGTFRDTGSGPVGVFLHGLLSDANGTKSMSLWQHAVNTHRSWVRFDMRAHGESDGTFDEFMISRAAEDTRRVLSQFAGRPKVLVGSSMGGWVAAISALDRRLKVCGLVLIAPAFNFVQSLFDTLSEQEQRQWENKGSRLIESPYPDCNFALSIDAVRDARQFDLLDRPLKFECPVHILHGQLDDVVPPALSESICEHCNSPIRLTLLENADHRLTDHSEHILKAVDQIWPD